MKKVVAYYRVSTKGQGESGLGLDAQKEYVARAAEQNNWEVIAEFEETISGSIPLEQRPQGALAASMCKELGATLAVAKLDRLSRDVEHIAGLIKRLPFTVATMPEAKPFELHLFAALAEQEREFIRQRTKEGLKKLQDKADAGDEKAVAAIARRDAGRAKSHAVNGTKAVQAATAQKMALANHRAETFEDSLRACLQRGIKTYQGIADCLNAKKITTSRGSQFQPMTVKRLMERLNIQLA